MSFALGGGGGGGRRGSGGRKGGGGAGGSRAELVAAARKQREARRQALVADKQAQAQAAAASVLQRGFRRHSGRRRARQELRQRWDAELQEGGAGSKDVGGEVLYGLCGRLLLFCAPALPEDAARLSSLCRRLTSSGGLQRYCSLCLQPKRSAAWIKQIKRLCALCLAKLGLLPAGPKQQYAAEVQLLIMLTDVKCWQLKVPPKAQPILARVVAATLGDMVAAGMYPSLRRFLLSHELLKGEPLWASSVLALAARPLGVGRSDAATEAFATALLTLPVRSSATPPNPLPACPPAPEGRGLRLRMALA